MTSVSAVQSAPDHLLEAELRWRQHPPRTVHAYGHEWVCTHRHVIRADLARQGLGPPLEELPDECTVEWLKGLLDGASPFTVRAGQPYLPPSYARLVKAVGRADTQSGLARLYLNGSLVAVIALVADSAEIRPDMVALTTGATP